MAGNNIGIELENYLDPRVTTLAELREAALRREANPIWDQKDRHIPAATRHSADSDPDDVTMEDLMPAVLPVTGILGLVLIAVVAALTAGAVFVVLSLLHR